MPSFGKIADTSVMGNMIRRKSFCPTPIRRSGHEPCLLCSRVGGGRCPRLEFLAQSIHPRHSRRAKPSGYLLVLLSGQPPEWRPSSRAIARPVVPRNRRVVDDPLARRRRAHPPVDRATQRLALLEVSLVSG